MKKNLLLSILFILLSPGYYAQTNGVGTYINPVQPGDHPDQTLMRVGKDFYTTGSTFHLGAYVPIYHSTDLVHWDIIARVVPMGTSGVNDGPGAGIWQGGLAQFGGYFWVYYSINSAQYFSKASAMTGPWSSPTRVTGSTVTGYDNSIFVDDDGTPYMLMKNGKTINRIQQIDKTTGQLTGTLLNCDWMNASGQYSWAEGPTMCKRNGRYYYFVAGNVAGGQYVLSSAKLSANEADWTRHGDFFTAATNASGLSSPNHVSQPILLDDGTWWCISHAYDYSGWQAQGRLCNLHQVIWDANGVPHAVNPSKNPVTAPNLPNTGNIAMNLPREDYFTSSTLDLDWHFFNKTTATKYSLTASPGNMRLIPGTGTTHVLQKEGGHHYSMVTKVTVNAAATGQQAGLRIANGGDDAYFILYAGYNGSKKIGWGSNTAVTEVNNAIGNTVWLKIERENHSLRGYYSADGKAWTQIGGTLDAAAFDKDQGTDYNKWVGTSIGLYAKDITADFDLYKYRDGLSAIKAYGYNNYNGVSVSAKTPGSVVSNTTNGGWLMLAGVSFGDGTLGSTSMEVNAASASGAGSLEVWIDNIDGLGTKLATIPITASGGADAWKNYTANVTATGQHDLYLKFVGAAGAFSVNTVRFVAGVSDSPVVTFTAPAATEIITTGTPVTLTATATGVAGATIAKVDFYDGATLIKSVTASPFTTVWTPTVAGTKTITATATDSKGKTGSASLTINAHVPQSPYGGTAKPIPGTIQFEEYDEGGNDNAYFDNTPGSEVTPAVAFRTTEDVDIEACSDAGTGYNIGFAAAGEWLEYTVNVAAAGLYNITLRAACNADGHTVSLQAKGADIAKDIAIPNTTGWQVWENVTVPNISLSAGIQVIRITLGASDYVNLNYMKFEAVPVAVTGIALKTGWNLIGFPFDASQDIATALSSVWDNTLVVKNADSFYDKSADPMFNSLKKLQFSNGYLINVKTDCQLIWNK